jgi:hypothetical protein
VATSPLLIQYSQELRFYSAGLFFYLISAIFLLRALDRNRLSDWLACLATLVIGFYFHIYTLLALLNGFVWIFQFGWQNLFERSRLRNIVITGLILLGLVFPGFVRFSAETTYAYGQSLALALNSLVIGLGWLPFSGWEQSGIVYTLLCCLFSVVGIVAIFRSKERIFVGLLFGLFIQVLLVFLADVITGYFFAPRQFLFLMPFSYLLAARGLWFFWQKATPLFGHTSDLIKMEGIRRVNRIFSAGLFAVLLGYNGLALTGYYAFPKSYTREVSQVLAEIYQPGDHFRTIPSFEPLAYQFYLEHKLQDHRFSGAFETVSMAEIGKPPKVPGRIYVACKFPLLETEQQVLLTAGFQPLQSGVLGGSQLLWYRDD